MEETLEEVRMLVSHNIMLVKPRLNFPEIEPRIWVEREVDPVLPINPQVSDEETFRGSCKVEYSNYLVDLVYRCLGYRASRCISFVQQRVQESYINTYPLRRK